MIAMIAMDMPWICHGYAMDIHMDSVLSVANDHTEKREKRIKHGQLGDDSSSGHLKVTRIKME